ncbi:MAG: hypothetical protein M1816_003534 [Peltula sp. TS41687]|nr:MAG: hypothetical protein M1816_003534 [Peltula sp. TS41687]
MRVLRLFLLAPLCPAAYTAPTSNENGLVRGESWKHFTPAEQDGHLAGSQGKPSGNGLEQLRREYLDLELEEYDPTYPYEKPSGLSRTVQAIADDEVNKCIDQEWDSYVLQSRLLLSDWVSVPGLTREQKIEKIQEYDWEEAKEIVERCAQRSGMTNDAIRKYFKKPPSEPGTIKRNLQRFLKAETNNNPVDRFSRAIGNTWLKMTGGQQQQKGFKGQIFSGAWLPKGSLPVSGW